jgi:hypothetical protein
MNPGYELAYFPLGPGGSDSRVGGRKAGKLALDPSARAEVHDRYPAKKPQQADEKVLWRAPKGGASETCENCMFCIRARL